MSKKNKDKSVNRAFQQLEQVYKSIPDTKGCMEHINMPRDQGGCGGWCCLHQNPHVLHIEFLNTWKSVLRSWDWEDVVNLIERAIRSYLSVKPTKGCIFFDKESKLCTIHKTRPFNCRVYGITPEEEMKPRIERLKILYKNRIDAVVKDQCNLVSTTDGTVVTTDMTAKWWKQMVEVEELAGTKKKDIHDRGDGSYMTFHDHILIHVCPDVVMKQLQILRMHGEIQEKETAILGIMAGFKKKIRALKEEQNVTPQETKVEENSVNQSTQPVVDVKIFPIKNDEPNYGGDAFTDQSPGGSETA